MYRVIVFAGTTEGYAISRYLAENKIPVCACVATEYGSKSLEQGTYLDVRTGRMDAGEMEALFGEQRPELVLDATHPYAAEVTENIRSACERASVAYQRVLRESDGIQEGIVYVDSTHDAVEFLRKTEGNILLTTGSKELAAYTQLPDYENRLYARVLSLPSILETCRFCGIEGKHLIGMQGPFSREMNVATLRQYDCKWLVTKDTGAAGGFREKTEAAAECGAAVVVIGRPLQETGITVRACRKMLAQRFGFPLRPKVTLLGIGTGGVNTRTEECRKALEEAELVIGASRMVEASRLPHHEVFCEYRSEVIAEYIREHAEYEHIAVVFSGDIGFFSGAKKLLQLLEHSPEDSAQDTEKQPDIQVRMVCGVSSLSYFMAKIGLSWDDARIVSAHGRDCNLPVMIRHNRKVFSILGTKTAVAELSRKLVSYGMGDVLLYVGENLSYPNEKIFVETASRLEQYEGDSLSVVCACNEHADALPATHGITDAEFLRGKAPMTKEEVRTVSLSKLRLSEDSVCYDVGAGTGSVAIEMALRAYRGTVYAIEKKEDAVHLLEENRQKFAADNLEIVYGTAPEALDPLPAPTHAFVGGSSGNLRQILALLLQKNPSVRIVINCITLEAVTEALEAVRTFRFMESDIVQVTVSRARELGRYHRMMGENPIYIITCQYPGKDRETEHEAKCDHAV